MTNLTPFSIGGKSKNYFSKQLKILRLFGVSLNENESFAYKIYSFLIISFMASYVVVDFREMFKHDFKTICSFASYATSGLMALAKVSVVLRNRSKFGKLLSKLEQEPFLPNQKRGGDVEESLLTECIWMTTVQTSTYWVAALVTLFAGVFYTLLLRLTSDDYRDWKFGYGPFTVVNVTYSPNYELSWLYQNVAVMSITAVFTTSDLLIAAVLTHICYQFKILQNFLRRLVLVSSYKMANKNSAEDDFIVPWKYLKQTVEEAVDYHLAILNLGKEMEEVFSQLLLLVFLGTLSLVCLSTLQASQVSVNNLQFLRLAGEGVTALLQVLMVCYWSEQLAYESQLVGTAVYESDFIGTDLRFQKSLILIIRRSQNPVNLTAGKFTDISLETFAWIVRTSYSAFLMLGNLD